MRLAELVAGVHGAFDAAAAMADVAKLCEFDRYQASAGIHAAASYVAQRAVEAGLHDVRVLRFPADGNARWWTFAAPAAWTPKLASLHVDGAQVVSYPDQPYALAANSAGACARLPLVHWSARGRPDVTGAVVVLDDAPLPVVLEALTEGGAAGVVTDPLAGRPGRWTDQVGRIELPSGCPLFAFSVTEAQAAELRRAAQRGASVDVLVEVDSAASGGTLPVVTGRLPGGPGELLLSAHLCHPRPSANDNASGVAALLELARAHRALGDGGHAVRFVWAPEFVGMAAYLHDVVRNGAAPVPVAAVNVDMAGEDQRRCGGPLVIERAPDELPSAVSAVAERCAALIPPAARSYSGAVGCDTWAWRATPFVGASDHGMLAGPPTRCPAVSIGHWPDHANHTGADGLELVDPDELRRSATIAGATIAALRDAGDPELAADVTDATVSWAAGLLLSAMPGAAPVPPPLPPPVLPPASSPVPPPVSSPPPPVSSPVPPPVSSPVPPGLVLDPWAPEHARRLVAHRGAVGRDAVRSLPGTERQLDWLDGLTRHLLALCPDGVSPEPPAGGGVSPEPPAGGGVLVARWDGPLNLRHLNERADRADRAWLADVTAADRGGAFARLHALARGIDGRRDRGAVAWWAALASGLVIPLPMAGHFLDLLCRTGLATTATE